MAIKLPVDSKVYTRYLLEWRSFRRAERELRKDQVRSISVGLTTLHIHLRGFTTNLVGPISVGNTLHGCRSLLEVLKGASLDGSRYGVPAGISLTRALF